MHKTSLVLPRHFYNRPVVEVAKSLLGKILIRRFGGELISGRIIETEAYLGQTDPASHTAKGMTPRTEVVFGEAGHAYIHSIHMQNCIDIVTGAINEPTSVLIRALEPLQGIEQMKIFRNKENLKDLTSGPGKLTQALQITKQFYGYDITDSTGDLYLVDDGFVPAAITIKKRVGISKAQELDLRFYITESDFVSKR